MLFILTHSSPTNAPGEATAHRHLINMQSHRWPRLDVACWLILRRETSRSASSGKCLGAKLKCFKRVCMKKPRHSRGRSKAVVRQEYTWKLVNISSHLLKIQYFTHHNDFCWPFHTPYSSKFYLHIIQFHNTQTTIFCIYSLSSITKKSDGPFHFPELNMIENIKQNRKSMAKYKVHEPRGRHRKKKGCRCSR